MRCISHGNAVSIYCHDPEDNIVEVYIGYLRRKVDAPFGTSSLKTVRGFGYRLDPVGVSRSTIGSSTGSAYGATNRTTTWHRTHSAASHPP